jgi:hypothetical protein
VKHTRELVGLLPYVMRDKVRYYLDYVNDRLIDLALESGLYSRVREIQKQVELIFVLRLLYGYFVIGFQNYERMLNYFETMEVDGFQIGSRVFSKRSPITSHWQQVANNIKRLVSETGTSQYVKPTMSTDMVLRQIIQSLPDKTGEKQDREQH